jgi:hypothetical protein
VRERTVVRVRGCSCDDLKRFFKALLERLKGTDAQEYQDGHCFGFRTKSGDYHVFECPAGFTAHFPGTLFVVINRPRSPLLFIEHAIAGDLSGDQPPSSDIAKVHYAHIAVPKSDWVLLGLSIVVTLSAACLPQAIRLHLGGLFKGLGIFGLFLGPALLVLSVWESNRYDRTWRVLLAVLFSFAATAIGWGTLTLFVLGRFF